MGAYSGFLVDTINPMRLISPFISQEAVLSSKLEGTHATIEDFIHYDAGNEVSVPKDEMHKILLDNIRAQTKAPGEFKTEQNDIGSSSSSDSLPV